MELIDEDNDKNIEDSEFKRFALGAFIQDLSGEYNYVQQLEQAFIVKGDDGEDQKKAWAGVEKLKNKIYENCEKYPVFRESFYCLIQYYE